MYTSDFIFWVNGANPIVIFGIPDIFMSIYINVVFSGEKAKEIFTSWGEIATCYEEIYLEEIAKKCYDKIIEVLKSINNYEYFY